MPDAARLHEEKYRSIRAAGEPGWGGASRIGNLPKMVEERFLSLEGIPRSGRLLELGCGAGNLSIELAKRGYEVFGVDFAESAVTWARDNARHAQVSIDFRLADVTNLSLFATGFFDLVYDGNCVHCLIGESREKAFREAFRVLRPGGIFFVSSLCASGSSFPAHFNAESGILFEGSTPYRYIPTPELLEGELSGAGFKVLKRAERQECPFGHVSIHAQRGEHPPR